MEKVTELPEKCPKCGQEPLNYLFCDRNGIEDCPVPHGDDIHHVLCHGCKHEFFVVVE
jgi:hypothetical protein